MRGDNHLLALTVTKDEITDEVKPLFAFPVQVCKATADADEVKFDIAAPSGAAREMRYIDPATGEVVDDDDCLRGIRIGEQFKAVPQEAIDTINDATKIKTMVALGKVPLATVREKYADRITGRYYLQSPAKGGSPKAYRLTYEALREVRTGKKVTQEAQAIVTKRTARSRQKLAFIYADEDRKCLVMCEVTFAAKVREPDDQILAPQTAEVEAVQIEKARQVIGTLPDGIIALETEVDDAITMREALIEQAIAGEAIAAPTPVAETVEADNLEAALEASLAAV